MPLCRSCSQTNPAEARFCLACGVLITSNGQSTGNARKTVTMVFADLAESSRLGECLDPESLRQVMEHFFAGMQQVLLHHGGTVEKFIGDAVMAVFGAPTLHEDDADRALRAAAGMHERLDELNKDFIADYGVTLQLRVGVNTGEVVTGDPGAGQLLVTGEPVNLTARLQQAARPGETLLGNTTFELVKDTVDVEPVELPAGAGRQRSAYLLRALLPGGDGARRLSSPMVGREPEEALLHQLFERTARDRVCHLLTLLGPAGIGKSRLVNEFLAGIAPGATVLEGRCLPYGDGITYWPVVEMLRQAAGVLEDDTPESARVKLLARLDGSEHAEEVTARLLQLLGLSEASGTPEQSAWAVRSLLAALATSQPLVVLIDDLHWAEPTLLDLVEHIADWSRETPLLLLATARAELLEHRPGWGGGKLNATSLQLEPLSTATSERLVNHLLGAAELPPGARNHIVARSEGNPLFIEELLGMLIDGGRLRRDRAAWVATTDLAAISVPPTIQALLAARLDQLSPGERTILQRASVIGPVFWRGALADLVPPELRDGLDEDLGRLVRKEMIRPERSEVAGELSYRFRHLLVQDAAYRGVAKAARAELHERFANWLVRLPADSGLEQEEILGFHLEQAYRYRAALGPPTADAGALASRAVDRLDAAATRASARGDKPAVVKLLGRATELTPTDSRQRRQLLPRLGAALRAAGDLARAGTVLDEAVGQARALRDDQAEARAVTERAFLTLWTDRDASAEQLRDEIERAIRLLGEVGDERGLARAWGLLSEVRFFQGQMETAQGALERAIRHAERAGATRQAARLAGRRTLALTYGPTPVHEVIASVERVLAVNEAQPDRIVEASALAVLAIARAMTGAQEEARALHERATRLFEVLGLKAMTAWQASGRVHLLGDDPATAELELRRAYAIIEELGQHNYRPVVAAYLSQALYLQGRLDEAGHFSVISRDTAATDSALAQLLWRGAHARVLAGRGHLDQALLLATEAVALTDGTDITEKTADVHMDLVEVLRLAGRPSDAVAPLRRAVELYDQKGSLVLGDRARLLLAELSRDSPALEESLS